MNEERIRNRQTVPKIVQGAELWARRHIPLSPPPRLLSAQPGLSGQSLIPECFSVSQFPFQAGLMVAVTMSSLVSLSRLYTGMHSVLVKCSRHVRIAAFSPRAGLIMHIFMFPYISND